MRKCMCNSLSLLKNIVNLNLNFTKCWEMCLRRSRKRSARVVNNVKKCRRVFWFWLKGYAIRLCRTMLNDYYHHYDYHLTKCIKTSYKLGWLMNQSNSDSFFNISIHSLMCFLSIFKTTLVSSWFTIYNLIFWINLSTTYGQADPYSFKIAG